MSWPTGLTWTKGGIDVVENPGEKEHIKVRIHSGPFLYFKNLLGWEIYAGFRPTAPWTHGGNEGFIVLWKRWLQKEGASNLGFAFRRAH